MNIIIFKCIMCILHTRAACPVLRCTRTLSENVLKLMLEVGNTVLATTSTSRKSNETRQGSSNKANHTDSIPFHYPGYDPVMGC